MTTPDDFSTYLEELLHGTYDCVDRISLRGYYPMGQSSGGLLTWWNQLHPGVPLTAESLRKMAGDFGRRVNAYARKREIPIHYCQLGDKTKHARAEKLAPPAPTRGGLATLRGPPAAMSALPAHPVFCSPPVYAARKRDCSPAWSRAWDIHARNNHLRTVRSHRPEYKIHLYP